MSSKKSQLDLFQLAAEAYLNALESDEEIELGVIAASVAAQVNGGSPDNLNMEKVNAKVRTLLEENSELSDENPEELVVMFHDQGIDQLAANNINLVKPVKPIRNETPKPGRNDPCDCGCGKKVKKCPNRA